MHTIDRVEYLKAVLPENPAELIRLAHTAAVTAKFRFLKGCVGSGTIVEPDTRIVNSANVEIGRNCLIREGAYIRAGAQGKVVLGDGAALNSFCRIFGHGTVEIGEDTQVGPGTLITTTGHDYERNLESHYRPIQIGSKCWIGGNVTVLPGVSIGNGTVIGAGSVVNKDVPAKVVAVGVPARVVKQIPESQSSDSLTE